jgi:hypothetical protein
MAVIGASAQRLFDPPRGEIGGADTWTLPQDIKPPANILAFPVLLGISESDDQTSARAFIADFTDAHGFHPAPNQHGFPAVASTSCSHITWALHTDNCVADVLRVILFFG